jgi:hypothetical protein
MADIALGLETEKFGEEPAHFSKLTALIASDLKSCNCEIYVTRVYCQETSLRSILLDAYRDDNSLLFSPRGVLLVLVEDLLHNVLYHDDD